MWKIGLFLGIGRFCVIALNVLKIFDPTLPKEECQNVGGGYHLGVKDNIGEGGGPERCLLSLPIAHHG